MRKRFSVLAGILGGVVLVAGTYYVAKNPENTTLDAAVRAEAGSKYVTLSDGVTHYDISGSDSVTYLPSASPES